MGKDKKFDERKVKEFKAEAKVIVKDWIEHTTSHGLANILRTENWLIRIMWSAIFLLSLGYCSYVIIRSVKEFFEYKTTVSTEYVRETPTPFPAVTICNVNAFNENKALRFLLNKLGNHVNMTCVEEKIEISTLNLLDCVTENENGFSYVLRNILSKIKRSILNGNFTDNELEHLGFSLKNDMLLNCDFNGILCDESSFRSFWHNDFGMCYTFNSGNNSYIQQTSATGPTHGLVLELIVEPPNETLFAFRSGLYVFVHNQSIIPSTLSGAIFVPTQFETYIGVSRTFTKKEPSPYSDCISNLTPFSESSSKIFGYFADTNVTYYDQRLCLDYCYQDVVTKYCSCCTTLTNCIKGQVFCATDEELLCELKVEAEFSRADTNKICDNVCREPCASQEFGLSISSTTYPTTSYYVILRYILYPDRVFDKSSLVKIIVDYDDLSYTIITASPSVSFEFLMGNVGGQLGLFIGISLLSLLEVVEIIIELSVLAYNIFKKQKVNPSTIR